MHNFYFRYSNICLKDNIFKTNNITQGVLVFFFFGKVTKEKEKREKKP
jgi:hypothetical protein